MVSIKSKTNTWIKFKSFFTRSRHRRRDFKTWRSSSRSERCFGWRNDAIWSRRALEKCANRFLRHSGKLLRHIIRLQCFDPQKNMASVGKESDLSCYQQLLNLKFSPVSNAQHCNPLTEDNRSCFFAVEAFGLWLSGFILDF